MPVVRVIREIPPIGLFGGDRGDREGSSFGGFGPRGGAGPEPIGPHPKVELVERGGAIRVEFPFAPKVTHDGYARRYVEGERVGRKPRLGGAGRQLRTISYEALFAHKDHQRPIEGLLRGLERLADRGKAVRWRRFGPDNEGWFMVTALSVEDVLRQHGTNVRTRARVSMTLTEDPEVEEHNGPASGGHHHGSIVIPTIEL